MIPIKAWRTAAPGPGQTFVANTALSFGGFPDRERHKGRSDIRHYLFASMASVDSTTLQARLR